MKFSGIVKKGSARGRGMGFPTANLDISSEISDGIYAALVHYNTFSYYSVVFVGANVTFGETLRHVEAYILDFDQDLYGQEITVELIKKIRGNQKFSSPEELVAQMKRDEEVARRFFKNYNNSN